MAIDRSVVSLRSSPFWLASAALALLVSAGCGSLNSRSRNASGVRYYQQGYYPQAIQEFQQAMYQDPVSSDAYYNMAATLHRSGKVNQNVAELEQAESYYNQCLDRDRNHCDCHRALAVLLVEQDRSEEAFRLLEGWAVRSPALANPKIELARLFEEFNDQESTKSTLLEALAVEPNNPRALAAMGKIREQEGDPVQALANYQRSLLHDRDQPEVAARVAQLMPAYGSRTMPPPNVGNSHTVSNTMPSFR